MYQFESIKSLFSLAAREGTDIAEIMIRREMELTQLSRSEVMDKMAVQLEVIREAAERGVREEIRSMSGLTGGDGRRLYQLVDEGRTITGGVVARAVARALGVAEVNAAMGKVVAAPTAGSGGIIPGVLLTVAEERNKSQRDLIKALFAASAIGLVIAEKAMLSGAAGGCQAECGAASGMAAGAAVFLLAGNSEKISHAVAIALKNSLGLVCDPVAGLVEVPCVKRNAAGAANALISAEMALAGIKSAIPADEVIEAMGRIGASLPEELRETSQGGLAVTPTACRLSRKILKKNK